MAAIRETDSFNFEVHVAIGQNVNLLQRKIKLNQRNQVAPSVAL